MKKAFAVILCICFAFLFAGCAVEAVPAEKQYAREYYNELPVFWGYEELDDEDLICYYVYHSEAFNKKYGDKFEIKEISGSGELESPIIPIVGLKGYSEQQVKIDNDIWLFEMKKEPLCKWEIKDYYQCKVDPEDGDVLLDDNGNIVKY